MSIFNKIREKDNKIKTVEQLKKDYNKTVSDLNNADNYFKNFDNAEQVEKRLKLWESKYKSHYNTPQDFERRLLSDAEQKLVKILNANQGLLNEFRERGINITDIEVLEGFKNI